MPLFLSIIMRLLLLLLMINYWLLILYIALFKTSLQTVAQNPAPPKRNSHDNLTNEPVTKAWRQMWRQRNSRCEKNNSWFFRLLLSLSYLKSLPCRFPFSGSPGSGQELDACLTPPSFTAQRQTGGEPRAGGLGRGRHSAAATESHSIQRSSFPSNVLHLF